MENEKTTETKQQFIEEPIKALNALFRLLYEGQEFTNSEYNFWLKLHQIVAEALEKLDQLEEIEKELGIDLITFFKVIKQGHIFVEEQNTKEKEIVAEEVEPNFLNHTFDFKERRKEIGKGRPFSRIGETWALTKEELENERK